MFIDSANNKPLDVIFDVSLGKNHLITKQKQTLKPESDGSVKVKFDIPLKSMNIIQWFPNGVKDNTQKLYELSVGLSFPNSLEVSKQAKKIGFRLKVT